MEFTIGFISVFVIMFAITKRLQIEWRQEIEDLKDFDTWKEWKNKK